MFVYWFYSTTSSVSPSSPTSVILKVLVVDMFVCGDVCSALPLSLMGCMLFDSATVTSRCSLGLDLGSGRFPCWAAEINEDIQGRPEEPDLSQSQVSLHVHMYTYTPPPPSERICPVALEGGGCLLNQRESGGQWPHASKTVCHFFVTWESDFHSDSPHQ